MPLSDYCQRLLRFARSQGLVGSAVPDLAVWNTVPLAARRPEIFDRLNREGLTEGTLGELQRLTEDQDRRRLAALFSELERGELREFTPPPFPGFAPVAKQKGHTLLTPQQRQAIDLILQGRQSVSIVGRSGAGKTTLLQRLQEEAQKRGRPVVMINLEDQPRLPLCVTLEELRSIDLSKRASVSFFTNLRSRGLSLKAFQRARGILVIDEFHNDLAPGMTIDDITGKEIQTVFVTFDVEKQVMMESALRRVSALVDITPPTEEVANILVRLGAYEGNHYLTPEAAMHLAATIVHWGGSTREALRFADWLAFLVLPHPIVKEDVETALAPASWQELALHVFSQTSLEIEPRLVARFVEKVFHQMQLTPRGTVEPPLLLEKKIRSFAEGRKHYSTQITPEVI